MQRVARILYWQWAFLFVALLFLIEAGPSLTGHAVLQSEDTDQFAPPYDAFTGQKIISLTHRQSDAESFEVDVAIAEANGMIYHHLYYYTAGGWRRAVLPGDEWLGGSAAITIEGEYASFTLREGDDFYIGAWVCKGVDDEWRCGCKEPADCGYWHVQGVDLESEALVVCPDSDGDLYGVTNSVDCIFSELDCDDDDASVNPGMAEVPYNGVDDDCDETTRDDDLDLDGYLLANDCDDSDSKVHPAATEVCGDGKDQDCDGQDLECDQCGEGSIPGTGCVCGGTSRYEGYCCDNTFQYAACGTPEVIFYDGFESGTANTWDYLNPNSKVNQDMPYSGQYGLDLIYMSGSTSLKKDQYADTALAESRDLFLRYYVYFEEDFIHPVDGLSLFLFGEENDWGVELLIRRWQGDDAKGRLSLVVDGSEQVTSRVLDNGHWYCIEQEVLANDDGAANGAVRLWVDDVGVYDQSGVVVGDGGKLDYLKLGGYYDGDFGLTPIHVYLDNVVVSRQRVGCS
ncbi:putative metal-binding motif-containing protein [Candidatus Woesearchaeota archaeon]|nr:putative metal-binding motif-containing protein [Candidatus Woesearchaeota archaeon]